MYLEIVFLEQKMQMVDKENKSKDTMVVFLISSLTRKPFNLFLFPATSHKLEENRVKHPRHATKDYRLLAAG